ncbi:MAG: hypothetical protein FWF36_03265 [Propionibacteriaceae bacterium]|nr:hypothetical protein [Propionibacteriaceae bacterium]
MVYLWSAGGVVFVLLLAIVYINQAKTMKAAAERQAAFNARVQAVMNRTAELEGKRDSGQAFSQDQATELSRLHLEPNQVNTNQALVAQQNIAAANQAVARQVAQQTFNQQFGTAIPRYR